jgi:hypothetical protein
MIDQIDNLIERFGEYNIDMIDHLSLSSCASAIKYGFAYKDFNINETYQLINKEPLFKLSLQQWKSMIEQYNKKDAREAIRRLKEKVWLQPTQELIDSIDEDLLHSEFDNITLSLDNYLASPPK